MYQYFRNVNDEDVEHALKLLTFLPLEEIEKLASLEGKEINQAKEVLAYEFTKIVHGEEEANKALKAAKALFGEGEEEQHIPSTEMSKDQFEDEEYEIRDLMADVGITDSSSEAKRLIKQGGVYLNDERVENFWDKITLDDFQEGEAMLRKGKKTYHKIILK
jgi:tyrosyl-tRNA synthetase